MESSYMGYYLELGQNGEVFVYATVEEWRAMSPTTIADNEFRAKKFIEQAVSMNNETTDMIFDNPGWISDSLSNLVSFPLLTQLPEPNYSDLSLGPRNIKGLKPFTARTTYIPYRIENRDKIIARLIVAITELGKADMEAYILYIWQVSADHTDWGVSKIAEYFNISEDEAGHKIYNADDLLNDYWRANRLKRILGSFLSLLKLNILEVITGTGWDLSGYIPHIHSGIENRGVFSPSIQSAVWRYEHNWQTQIEDKATQEEKLRIRRELVARAARRRNEEELEEVQRANAQILWEEQNKEELVRRNIYQQNQVEIVKILPILIKALGQANMEAYILTLVVPDTNINRIKIATYLNMSLDTVDHQINFGYDLLQQFWTTRGYGQKYGGYISALRLNISSIAPQLGWGLENFNVDAWYFPTK